MAASFVDQANTGADALESSRSVSKPAGVGSGDYGVFFLVRWHSSNSFAAVTGPSGVTQRSSDTAGAGGSWSNTTTFLLKIAAESSFNFSWTGSQWASLSALFFTGVDPALDLSTAPFNAATALTTANFPSTSVTTVVDAALAWNGNSSGYTAATTHAPPTDFTEPSGADVDPWGSAYRISPGTGSQSASGATASISQDQVVSVLVALAPESAPPPPSGPFAMLRPAVVAP